MSSISFIILVMLPCLTFAKVISTPDPSQGCLHSDGKYYPLGSSFKPTPCEHCFCPKQGGRVACAILDCAMPSCVHPVRKDDQCCLTCPDGPNCLLGGMIIPAGKDIDQGKVICRCPPPFGGIGFGSHNLQAHCTPKIAE